MRRFLRSIRQFLSELRRRNVYQVALAYLAAGFVVVELADIAAGTFDLPGWFGPMVWVLVGLGFPIALLLAWALEMTPAGVRVEESEGSEEVAPAGSPQDLWVGASVLVLLLLGAWWLWGGLGGGEATDQVPEIEEHSIAVLPFEVSGAGAEEWRDGMVTMLSTGLDGAGGLRAIPDRTVFARWEEASDAKDGATTEEALSVARRTGARYAVVGSAGVLGKELRFSADVHEVSSGKRLGHALVRGSPDSITALTDRLTRDVLGILLEKGEEGIPSVDLASITTESLEALKAYLQGERHFRAGEYEAAAEDFDTAVQRDSTFALAYARLAISESWAGISGPDGHLRRAYQLSDQLPTRERRLVEALYIRSVLNHSLAAADTLRRLTEEYPDDPAIWYNLGEAVVHGNIPGGYPEAEKAFEEAVRLDPEVAPYLHHLVDLSMTLHHDSALAARRIEAHPAGELKNWFRALSDLNFGSDEDRQAAWARIDPLPIGASWWVSVPLQHPTDLALKAEVMRRVGEREDVDYDFSGPQAVNSFERGRLSEFVSRIQRLEDTNPTLGCNLLASGLTLDYPFPDSTLRRYIEPSRPAEDIPEGKLSCTGIHLIQRGRGEEVRAVIRRLRSAAPAPSDLPVEPEADRYARSLEGYRAWTTGNLGEAAKRWSGFNIGLAGAIWRGDLYRELGQLRNAAEWYVAAWQHPVAHERLGQLYEEMDKPEKARAAYERFIAAWKNADPALQDRVETARERLEALGEKKSAE